MADSIKIGNLDISALKVGGADCKVYIGDILLYPQSQPPTPTLQWVTFSNGDTIPSDLDVYGVSGISQDLLDTYGDSNLNVQFYTSRNWVEYYVYDSEGSSCGSGAELATDPMEIIFSEVSCIDYFNQGATVSGTIQLYIYA